MKFFLNLFSYNHEYLSLFYWVNFNIYNILIIACSISVEGNKINIFNLDFEYKYIVYMLGNIRHFFTHFIYIPSSDKVLNNFLLELLVEVPV